MAKNIVGEPIEEFVNKQIDNRQKVYGAGYNSKSVVRSPKVQNFLNNRNAWIKLASGVGLESKETVLKTNKTYETTGETVVSSSIVDTTREYLAGQQRLKDLNKFSTDSYFTVNDIDSLGGKKLAEKYVLFNGLQEFNGTSYKARSGTRQTNSWSDSQTKLYGGLGSNERGLQPTPGIISVDVETVNRGSIKRASVKIKAYNKFQFGIIEILYLRLGYIMMLEYGWDKYIEDINGTNKDPIIRDVGSTIIENSWFKSELGSSQDEIFSQIRDYESKYQGNYTGFFGTVNNFSWKLNADNTYDITINLISKGSVIESLQVNVPSNLSALGKIENLEKFADFLNDKAGDATDTGFVTREDEDTDFNAESIGGQLGTDKITQFLVKQSYRFYSYQGAKNWSIGSIGAKSDLMDVEQIIKRSFYKIVGVRFKYSRAIRFGAFLDFLKAEIIGQVVNGSNYSPRLEIDTDPNSSIVNYTLNTISVDPTLCLFSPIAGDISVNGQVIFDGKQSLLNDTEVYAWDYTFDTFAQKSSVNGILYGKLMNVYLNFNLILTSLRSNIDKENKLDLFKFLESICDGINRSMGNSTKIAPAIRNDNEIYFVDEVPIPGWEEHSGIKQDQGTKINLFGYNPDGTSNFVKDFSFQTKISNKLINQISVGATAAGGYKNATDSVGYKWWNRGLVNRFENKYEVSEYEDDRDDDTKLWETFKSRAERKTGFNRFGYRIEYLGYSKTWYRNYPDYIQGSNNTEVRRAKNDKENFRDGKILKRKALKWMKQTAALVNELKSQEADPRIAQIREYNRWFLKNTGYDPNKKQIIYDSLTSKSKSTTITVSSPYFKMASENLDAGANTYKDYLNGFTQLLADGFGINTGQTGFIPVDLSLTCEGLSGIKIYNKLNVNQRELPASYPVSLKFVITSLKDTISKNVWQTDLGTICQPPTNISPQQIYNITIPEANQPKDPGTGEYKGPEKNKVTVGGSGGQRFSVETNLSKNGLIYIPEETNKTQVVLHHTAGNSSIGNTILDWRRRSDRVSTHFIIQRDGTYEQLFDLKYWANHIGIDASNNVALQKGSIGIELENYGWFTDYFERKGDLVLQRKGLTKLKNSIGGVIAPYGTELKGGYKTITPPAGRKEDQLIGNDWGLLGFNTTAESYKSTYGGNAYKNAFWYSLPYMKSYRGYKYFQAYTDEQLITLNKILLQINKAYPNIPLIFDKPYQFNEQKKQWANMFPSGNNKDKTNFKYNTSKDALSGVPGLYTHNSYRSDKIDVVPHFELFNYLYARGNKYSFTDKNITYIHKFSSKEEYLKKYPLDSDKNVEKYFTFKY